MQLCNAVQAQVWAEQVGHRILQSNRLKAEYERFGLLNYQINCYSIASAVLPECPPE